MSRTADTAVLEDPDVLKFAERAADFCYCLIEKLDSLPKHLFLRQVAEKLPILYAAAHRLPDPYTWDDQGIENKDRPEAGIFGNIDLSREWREGIGSKLEPYRWISFLHDPVSLDDKKVIQGDLGDILADVYTGLLEGVRLFEQPDAESKVAGVWMWRFWYGLGWGHAAAEVILPIHHILNTHYDEDEEIFDR